MESLNKLNVETADRVSSILWGEYYKLEADCAYVKAEGNDKAFHAKCRELLATARGKAVTFDKEHGIE